MTKKRLLNVPVEHVDIAELGGVVQYVDAAKRMSFTAGETASAAEIFRMMIADDACVVVLALAGSTSAAGCMRVYADLIRYNMIDVVVATGASIVDMDFFEALGFRHYLGSFDVDDGMLREQYIDRIYSVFIDEEELQECDRAVAEIAASLPPGPYSSRKFIGEMGKWLSRNPHRAKKQGSLVQLAYEFGVPVFCPAFSDSSAGLGLIQYRASQVKAGSEPLTIDSVADFAELTQLKIGADETGIFIIGGGTPKNFIQDTVIGAEVLGESVPMHKYAVQVTTADARDGGCSGSTLSEAKSWGKVDSSHTQMVYAEATLVFPMIAAYAYHKSNLEDRPRKRLADLFEGVS